MTSTSQDWEPLDPDRAFQEAAMTDSKGLAKNSNFKLLPQRSRRIVSRGQRLINSVFCSNSSVDITDDQNFAEALERNINVCESRLLKNGLQLTLIL